MGLSTGACWGITSPITKAFASAGVSPLSIVTFRAMITSIVLGVFFFIKNSNTIIHQSYTMLRFYFICGLLSVVCAGGGYLMSLKYLSVAQALILNYTSPLVTLVLATFINHEQPTVQQLLAGILIILGVYYGMNVHNPSGMTVSFAGVIWGILGVIGLSGQPIYVRNFGQKNSYKIPMNAMLVVFYLNLFGCIVMFIGKTLTQGWKDLVNLTPKLLCLLILLTASSSIIGQSCFYSSMKYLPAATVSLLCTFEIVVGLITSTIFIGMFPSLNEVIGCLFIIAAIVCTSIDTKK